MSDIRKKQSPSFEIEAGFFYEGFKTIAGVDEAGRGALAGPLSVGLVIFNPELYSNVQNEGLDLVQDSKKITHQTRVSALDSIKRYAVTAEYELVSHDLVDKLNPNRATLYALEKILERIDIVPDLVLLDGTFSFKSHVKIVSVKKGDSLSLSIAASSIVAKVNRDLYMIGMEDDYPGYGFDKNKGYGTGIHMDALREKGYSDIHRKSYEPIKSMVSGSGAFREK